MSTPQNPLNFFRSYSYHHILVVCDGTETAEALTTQNEITAFDHTPGEEKFLPKEAENGGKYTVLINSMTDTVYTIKRASWTSVLVPNESTVDGLSHFRTMAVDGELVIEEPLGVNFLNTLHESSQQLGVDPNGLCFILKTIFVGIRDDGTTEAITNVRPLMFFAYDIGAMFDVTGAEYIFSFVGMVNGAARLPHPSAISHGFTYNLDPGMSLRDAIAGLSRALNHHYARRKEALIKEIAAKGLDDQINIDEDFTEVKYTIELDGAYDDSYLVGSGSLAPSQNRGNGDSIVASGTAASIERLIDEIFKTSQQVNDDANPQEETQDKYTHKITSTLKTGPDYYEVCYYVHRHKQAIIPVQKFLEFKPPEIDGKSQGIEFDYIFTGKNIDILSFDIKMQMGMTFFQTLAVSNSLPSTPSEIIDQRSTERTCAGAGSATKRPGDIGTGQIKKPLFLGMLALGNMVRNTRTPEASVSYNALLARHAAYENIEARMTIRGNIQLLEETTQQPSDIRIETPSSPQQIEASGYVSPHIMAATHRVPGYVKVNVYMPTASMPPSPEGSMYDYDYAQNFWYPGWYFLYSITHTFSEGEFTQDLEMFSLPTDAGQYKIHNKPDKPESRAEIKPSYIEESFNSENLPVKEYVQQNTSP
jgi:hypothetical protein